MSTTTEFSRDTTRGPMIRLFGEVSHKGQSDAVMAIRWCIQEQLVSTLSKLNITKPYLLVVVRPYRVVEEDGQETRIYAGESLRKLVPLMDEMTFISFSRSGLNEVTACIVYCETDRAKQTLGRVFLAGYRFSYDTRLFEYSVTDSKIMQGRHASIQLYGSNNSPVYGYVLDNTQDSIHVVVDEEMFAKEYSPGVKAWVNKFFGSISRNARQQCDMRKMVIASLGISLFYFPFAYVARVFQVIVGLWLGLRGLRMRSFVHPIQFGFADVMEEVKISNSMWFNDKNGNVRPLWRGLLNPVSPVVSGLILWGIGTIHVTRNEEIVGLIGWGWKQYFAVTAAVHVGLVLTGFVILLIAYLFALVIDKSLKVSVSERFKILWTSRRQAKRAEKQAADKRRQGEIREEIERALADITCEITSSNVSLSALPRQKRTLRLYFQSTKRKVCKPIAR